MAKGRAVAIVLDDVEKRELMALTRKHGEPQALAERARIVLAASSGLNNKEAAAKIGVCAATVGTWRNRFAERHMDGLYDEPRPGAPREIGDDEIASTIRKTLETRPKGDTHWSLRSMAKEIGHVPSTPLPTPHSNTRHQGPNSLHEIKHYKKRLSTEGQKAALRSPIEPRCRHG
jgi:transposase